MLSIIGTITICIVGAWLAIETVAAIFHELTCECSPTEYGMYLMGELSTEEIMNYGYLNLTSFAIYRCHGFSFDYCYDRFLSKEK